MRPLHNMGWIAATLLVTTSALGAAPPEPVIPDHHFSLAAFGTVGDGKTLNTTAFSKAVAAIKAAGGGTLEIPAGTYLTTPFQVTNHMELHLDNDATIKATDRFADFGLPEPLPATQAALDGLRVRPIPLIQTDTRLDDFILSGAGTIDGTGEPWWQHVNKPTYYKPGNLLLPRPRLIQLNCKNLVVRGITLINSPSFHLVPIQCDQLLVENVHITAPERAPNTDAIDPSGCKNVLIRGCTLNVGDDDVAIKAGSAGACENIEILDCTILHGHGVSIGSETFAGVKNMVVRNCTFDGTTPALRIKSGIDRGGNVTNILYDNITIKNASIAIELNMVYDPANGPNGARPGAASSVPHVSDVHFKNITVESAKQAMKIVGLPTAPIRDVTFENVSIHADTGMTVEEAQNILMKNVQVTPKKGEVLTTKNAEVTRQ